jgi:hypothetical protein
MQLAMRDGEGRSMEKKPGHGAALCSALVAALLTSPLAGVLVAGGAEAESMVVQGAVLPTARQGTVAVWDGSHAYVFGGHGTREIVRYDPATGEVRAMNATLPYAYERTAAVWDGQYAYLLGSAGGWAYGGVRILRYDPSSDILTTLGWLPAASSFAQAAVWADGRAYVFGGASYPGSDRILRYDPATETIDEMSARLPVPLSFASAVWDGNDVYVFGGNRRPSDGNETAQILRYRPATDTLTVLDATLPSPRSTTSAVWDGEKAYVFGGKRNILDDDGAAIGAIYTAEVVAFDPSTGSVSVRGQLPNPRAVMSAVWVGHAGYLFGGRGDNGNLAEIVRFAHTPPTEPRTLEAELEASTGDVTLAWDAPADDGGTHVTGYRVYRGSASGTWNLLAEEGTALAYEDTTCAHACYYVVRAVNGAGEGPASNEERLTAPGPPTGLLAIPGVFATSLSWNAPEDDGNAAITNYRVYRGPSATTTAFLADAGANLAYDDVTCVAGTTCYYQISAMNGMGEGPRTAPALAPGTSLQGGSASGPISTRTVQHTDNASLAPASSAPGIAVPGQATPDVPATAPVPGTPLATVVVCDSGAPTGCGAAGSQFLCVDLEVEASGGATVPLTCVNRGDLGAADPFIPRGNTHIVAPGVPGLPAQAIPDVPGASAGPAGTPALTVTTDVRFAYAPAHVAPGAIVLGSPLFWQPFLTNQEDATWFLTHGADVGLTVTVTLYADGDEAHKGTVSVPWLGQVIAAAQATGGTPP